MIGDTKIDPETQYEDDIVLKDIMIAIEDQEQGNISLEEAIDYIKYRTSIRTEYMTYEHYISL